MKSTSNLYQVSRYALLAESVYANFIKDGTVPSSIKDISSSLQYEDMSLNDEYAAQIQLIAQNYGIIDHQPNTGSGFSATLFQEVKRDRNSNVVENGEYVLAICGTEPKTKEDIGTDVGDIEFDGFSVDQIVDLYNFFQKLITTKTENYKIDSLNIDQEKTDRYRELFKELSDSHKDVFFHEHTEIISEINRRTWQQLISS